MDNTPTLSSPRQSGYAAWESGALWARGKSGEGHLSPRGGREVRNVKTEGHPRQARKGPDGGKGLSGTKKPLQCGKQERASE